MIRRVLALTVVALGGVLMIVAGGMKLAHGGGGDSVAVPLLVGGLVAVAIALVGFATRANWRR